MDFRTALRRSLTPLPLLIAAACTTAPGQQDGGGVAMMLAAPARASCAPPVPSETAAAVHATNSERAARGLPPVRGSAVLSAAAAAHACDMATRGRMTHKGSGGSGPAQRLKARGYRPAITAENIAAGPFDLRAALGAWSRSDQHRANILIPQLREVGIGHALGPDGRTRFWSAVYAAPR